MISFHVARFLRLTLGLSLVMLFRGAIAESLAQQQEVAEAGRIPYRQYCAVCHGRDGKGQGEMAKLLKVKPADLTRLLYPS
jgi:mono/diheme cytochrome c family protein